MVIASGQKREICRGRTLIHGCIGARVRIRSHGTGLLFQMLEMFKSSTAARVVQLGKYAKVH